MSESISRRGFLKWQVFVDNLSGKRVDPPAAGPRRRQAERYPYDTRVLAKCASWPKFVEVFTSDVSEGGLYVPVDASATAGEAIEIELDLPDGGTLRLVGSVARVVSAERAAVENRSPGLGVRLEPLRGEDMARFTQILDAARSAIPRPPRPTLIPAGSIRHAAANAEMPAADATLAPEDFAVAGQRAKAAGAAARAGTGASANPLAAALRDGDPPIVGIDLGTAFTSIAVAVGKKVVPLPWSRGITSSPSVVWFPSEREHVVGLDAAGHLGTDPEHTVASPVYLLGREYDDPEIQGFLARVGYRTPADAASWVTAELWGRQYSIIELCALVLEDARRAAGEAVGREVRQCVLAVPASFDEECTEALVRAAKHTEWEVLALIDEPSAVAMANRFEFGFGGVIGVYDFGGGCFDFSIVDVSRGDFAVLATAGESNLGGGDLDRLLAEAAAEKFRRAHGLDLRENAVEWRRLVLACERAKCVLSVDEEATIYVPEVRLATGKTVDLSVGLDRATFGVACAPLIARSLAAGDQALKLLDMKPETLSAIFLSGGTTYVPAVRQVIADYFHRPVRTGVPPEHAVCLGAAIRAAQLRGG